jgi:SAM-dependent methyltransferase
LVAGIDGLFTASLASMVWDVIGIDIDPNMLALARAKLTAVRAANYDLIEGDAYDVAELVREPVGFVFMANTLHGVPDKPRLAHAVAAALKPNGRFAIVNWHRRPREETTVLGRPRGPQTELRMAPDDVAAAVEPAGFIRAGVIELPPYHYGAIFKKPTE